MSPYAELHTHSYYSLLDGASSPKALVNRAAQIGLPALALTDHDAVYGAVEFALAAADSGIHPIFGAELTLENGHHLTLLVEDQTGWQNLCWLITQARHNAPKGEAVLPLYIMEGHTDGLIALSGCRNGEIAAALLRKDRDGACSAAAHYRDLFGEDRFWIELQNHLLPGSARLVRQEIDLAKYLGLGYVATNNVHYAERDGHRLQDVLVCTRHLQTLDDCPHLRPNSEYYLKSAGEMACCFAEYLDALTNTLRITERCRFKLHYGLQDLPTYPTPDGLAAAEILYDLCYRELSNRYPENHRKALGQLEHELSIIDNAGLANYFLIVWDIVRFAQEQGIRCQGRGSAANSVVAYLLGISPVDPLAHDLVFERFLSAERQVVPDIDIDFDAARREEVIQYVYEHYGHDHAAMACTFITFRKRSAMRDVGRVLGLPPEVMERGLRLLDEDDAELEHPWDQVLDLCEQIHGLPRHLGIHNGGMVITGAPLANTVSTEPATMPDRYVVQWDKEGLESSGLVKIDILGLRMLSLITEALDLIEAETGARPDMEKLTFDDGDVFDMIAAADTVGVFQVESRAQAQMLPRFRPRSFRDIIIAISLIRPGPLQGDMVHPYLRRRLGEEVVTYPHPALEKALGETLGVILFQEQVLKVAHDLAGFTPGRGEQLRRALGAKNAAAAIERFHDDFIHGARENGIAEAVAEEVFNRLRAFGSYSFAKSHAAAFAVLVYQSAWIKFYHPAAFYTALLNNQPMGFWSPAVIIQEAKRHDIPFLPVDVNHSQAACTLEDGRIRMGFSYVKNMGEVYSQQIVDLRGEVPFTGLKDFFQRTRLPRRLVENLIMAGGMDAWQRERRRLIWELGGLDNEPNRLDLVFQDAAVDLPPLSSPEQMGYEYEMLGLTLEAHPLTLYRDQLENEDILNSHTLTQARPNTVVEAAGLIVVHQAPPTAKGFHFITLEDEFGFTNVIVKPNIYAHYKRFLHNSMLIIVSGKVQREASVTNLIAAGFRSLADQSA